MYKPLVHEEHDDLLWQPPPGKKGERGGGKTIFGSRTQPQAHLFFVFLCFVYLFSWYLLYTLLPINVEYFFQTSYLSRINQIVPIISWEEVLFQLNGQQYIRLQLSEITISPSKEKKAQETKQNFLAPLKIPGKRVRNKRFSKQLDTVFICRFGALTGFHNSTVVFGGRM